MIEHKESNIAALIEHYFLRAKRVFELKSGLKADENLIEVLGCQYNIEVNLPAAIKDQLNSIAKFPAPKVIEGCYKIGLIRKIQAKESNFYAEDSAFTVALQSVFINPDSPYSLELEFYSDPVLKTYLLRASATGVKKNFRNWGFGRGKLSEQGKMHLRFCGDIILNL